MSGFLDTSVVVRYLVGDAPGLADRAERIIDGAENLQITDVIVAETAYVLTSVYEMEREVVVDHLVALLRKKNISTYALDKDLVLQALLLCRPSRRVSFADAMLWAAARSSGHPRVYTFDERFPAEGVTIRGSA